MSNLLCGWSLGSILAGLAVFKIASGQDATSRTFAEAVAAQLMIWGAIDLIFAFVGVLQAAKARRTPINPATAECEHTECSKLQRILQFNTRLNWFWVTCGVVLLASGLGGMSRGTAPNTAASLLGHGAGVILQGGFLFWYDRAFLARLATAFR